MQDRRLAQLYAAMGYPTTAREQASKISAPAVRFGTEIRIRQTEAGFAADRNQPAEALLVDAERYYIREVGKILGIIVSLFRGGQRDRA